jgi:hypothetical protein
LPRTRIPAFAPNFVQKVSILFIHSGHYVLLILTLRPLCCDGIDRHFHQSAGRRQNATVWHDHAPRWSKSRRTSFQTRATHILWSHCCMSRLSANRRMKFGKLLIICFSFLLIVR